jgi:hypothetical protein
MASRQSASVRDRRGGRRRIGWRSHLGHLSLFGFDRQQRARKAAVAFDKALASRAGCTAGNSSVALEEGKKNGIGCLEWQDSIYTIREILHRLAGRRGPLAVDFVEVAAHALQLALQFPHEPVASYGYRQWQGHFARARTRSHNNGCWFGGTKFWHRRSGRGEAGDGRAVGRFSITLQGLRCGFP